MYHFQLDNSYEHLNQSRQDFLQQLKSGEAFLNQALCSLYISAEHDALISHSSTSFPVQSFLNRIESLAQGASAYLKPNMSAPQILQTISDYLFKVQQYQLAENTKLPYNKVVTFPGYYEKHYESYLDKVLINGRGRKSSLIILYYQLFQRVQQIRPDIVNFNITFEPNTLQDTNYGEFKPIILTQPFFNQQPTSSDDQLGLSGDQPDSLNNNPDSLNNNPDSLNNNPDSLNNNPVMQNHQSDLSKDQSDSLNHQSDLPKSQSKLSNDQSGLSIADTEALGSTLSSSDSVHKIGDQKSVNNRGKARTDYITSSEDPETESRSTYHQKQGALTSQVMGVQLNTLPQDFLIEQIQYLKRCFWPYPWVVQILNQTDSCEEDILGYIEKGGFQGACDIALQRADLGIQALQYAAKRRQDRGISTSTNGGDIKRAISCCELLVIMIGDQKPYLRRDFAVLLIITEAFDKAYPELLFYKEHLSQCTPSVSNDFLIEEKSNIEALIELCRQVLDQEVTRLNLGQRLSLQMAMEQRFEEPKEPRLLSW